MFVHVQSEQVVYLTFDSFSSVFAIIVSKDSLCEKSFLLWTLRWKDFSSIGRDTCEQKENLYFIIEANELRKFFVTYNGFTKGTTSNLTHKSDTRQNFFLDSTSMCQIQHTSKCLFSIFFWQLYFFIIENIYDTINPLTFIWGDFSQKYGSPSI